MVSMFDAHERDDGRRVDLNDLTGPLELIAVLGFAYALSSLRKRCRHTDSLCVVACGPPVPPRRELSLSWMCHMLAMSSLLFIIGHFLEEHALGRARLEDLLRNGFQGLSGACRVRADFAFCVC
jgi:hypothetical protein